ncbi:MAG: polyprenyl synthetase family protein [Candidatus Muiribacteriota bacterium]
MNDNLKIYLKKAVEYTDEGLKTYFPTVNNPASRIIEAMEYSLFAGGKRVRPALAYLSADIFNLQWKKVLPFACAVEMVHTYSLIHDDLPAMDDDDLRRGKPTNHKVYGEGIAVLSGDALITEAFDVLSDVSPFVDYKDFIRILKEFSFASGYKGMVGGQTADILLENKKADEKELQFIHELKTGRLITLSCRIPAIIAGADEDLINKIDILGNNIGMLFQITDDMLDVTGEAAKLGKTPGKDAKNQKNTYVTLYGLSKTKKIAEEVYQNTKKNLQELKASENFYHLVDFIYKRDY